MKDKILTHREKCAEVVDFSLLIDRVLLATENRWQYHGFRHTFTAVTSCGFPHLDSARRMAACHWETTPHAAQIARISWFDRYRLLWHPSPAAFFEFLAERFLILSIRFGGCATWFLIAQSRFFEQPAAARD